MYRLPCKIPSFFKAAYLLPLLLLSCALADLRPIGLSTIPESPWALLAEENSEVILIFDTEMEKLSVERALQVSSPTAQWKGS